MGLAAAPCLGQPPGSADRYCRPSRASRASITALGNARAITVPLPDAQASSRLASATRGNDGDQKAPRGRCSARALSCSSRRRTDERFGDLGAATETRVWRRAGRATSFGLGSAFLAVRYFCSATAEQTGDPAWPAFGERRGGGQHVARPGSGRWSGVGIEGREWAAGDKSREGGAGVGAPPSSRSGVYGRRMLMALRTVLPLRVTTMLRR